jgi:hypothetical protein
MAIILVREANIFADIGVPVRSDLADYPKCDPADHVRDQQKVKVSAWSQLNLLRTNIHRLNMCISPSYPITWFEDYIIGRVIPILMLAYVHALIKNHINRPFIRISFPRKTLNQPLNNLINLTRNYGDESCTQSM